ncbi:hypothetical protein GQX74_014355 [Glossina fuscipes]|nr:hypothetical protein GQX74_014355 [Glossina fuscipes]
MKVLTLSVKNDDETNDYDNDDCSSDELDGQPIFLLNGKRLQLLQPLDRDEENLSHIVFQVSCTIRSSQKRRNIPIIVRVSDVNDNAPRFMNTPYEVTVPEEFYEFVVLSYSVLSYVNTPVDDDCCTANTNN